MRSSVSTLIASGRETPCYGTLMKNCEHVSCGQAFEPQRSTARFCSAKCRVAASRARKAASVTSDLVEKLNAPAFSESRSKSQARRIAEETEGYPCCAHCPFFRHPRH